jgi:hypothetical protein
VQFSYCTLLYPFSMEKRAPDPFFMFRAAELIFCDSESVGSRFLISPGLIFIDTEDIGSSFHVLRYRTHFQRYRGSQAKFSCFALHNLFPAVLRTSSPVFLFCAPGLILGGAEWADSSFQLLRS